MLLGRERYVLVVVRPLRKGELGLQTHLFERCEDMRNQAEAVSSVSKANEHCRDPVLLQLIASPPPQ